MELPVDLRSRPRLALTRAVERVPSPGSLPGGCQYEPKWDGFRLAIIRQDSSTTAWSRNGRDLTTIFPDLIGTAAHQVPAGFVLDGEAVIWGDNEATSFEALQQRTTTRGPALAALARARPASFVCFDLLAVASHDVRRRPLGERRALLETLASSWEPPLTLAPATTDVVQAEAWFHDLTGAGLEGLVVKGLGTSYPGGRREWVKVKHRSSLEVVCAAVIGPHTRPRALVAGLPVNGVLRIVGRTGQLSATASAQVGAVLQAHDPALRPHPWPQQVPPSWFDHYSPNKGPVALTPVVPVVVEVAADAARAGMRFRHQLRYLRVRLDLDPSTVA